MNTKTKPRTQTPADCRVIVTVSGGVADVLLKPKGVEIRIIDYDADGEDRARLDRDPDGQYCCIQRHGPDAPKAPNPKREIRNKSKAQNPKAAAGNHADRRSV